MSLWTSCAAGIRTSFPGGTIDYLAVNEEIYSYVKKFSLRILTFDQYSSTQTIQDLQRRAHIEGLWCRPQIYERTATATQNHQGYELFKTVVNAGLLHAPPHDLARAELEHLTLKGDKVVAPGSGPVRTKDVADAMVNVVWTLLHEGSEEIFAGLAGLSPPAPNLEDCSFRVLPTKGSATSGRWRPSE